MKIQYYVFLSTETKHYGTWFSFWVQFYPPKSHKNKNTPSFGLNNNTAFFYKKKKEEQPYYTSWAKSSWCHK